MIILGLAVTVFELILFGAWLFMMSCICQYDRRSINNPKWYALFGGALLAAMISWGSWTLAGVWLAIWTYAFWMPVFYYICIGLVYSVFEFMLAITRAAKVYRNAWAEFNKRPGGTINGFVMSTHFKEFGLVRIKHDGEELSPYVDRDKLGAFIGTITILWPFYLISLIFGDAMTWLYRRTADLFILISDRYLRNIFKDVFK